VASGFKITNITTAAAATQLQQQCKYVCLTHLYTHIKMPIYITQCMH